MPTNNDHTPEQEEFSRLINDLRTMPRVKAPSNLEYLLEQKLHVGEQQKESWWKRFFLSGFKVGGFRVPVYAYGPVAAVLVVFLGIYVYNATNFESQLPDLEADQMMEHQQVQPSPDPNPPSPPTSTTSVDGESKEESSKQTSGARLENQPPASTPSAPRQAPVPTPKPIPTEMEEQPARRGLGAGSNAPTDNEGMMDRTRGRPDAYVPEKDADKAEPSLREKTDDRLDEAETKIESGRQSNETLMKEGKKKLESQGQYMMMSLTSPKDSLRILDSLRRIDSLRNLNKQR